MEDKFNQYRRRIKKSALRLSNKIDDYYFAKVNILSRFYKNIQSRRSEIFLWIKLTNRKAIRHFAAINYYVSWLIVFAIIGGIYYYYHHPEIYEAINETSCTTSDVLKTKEAVVLIQGKDGSGSGFWVDRGLILTNNHVVKSNPELKAWDDNGTYLPVKVIATDTMRDFALLSTDTIVDHQITWGGNNINLADDVYVMGYPGGVKFSVAKGIVSAFVKDDYDDREYIQTDAAINPGNSGGPLVDNCGRIVGVNTYSMYDTQNIGFSISSEFAQKRIEAMKIAAANSTPLELSLSYPSDQAEIVARYYDTLSDRKLVDAYNFYSYHYKIETPYDIWEKGMHNTAFITVKSVEPSGVKNQVKIDIITSDYNGISYSFITKEFSGTWDLVRESGLWKLDGANIKEITKKD